jgi:NUAK family SNF1-like kinase
VHRVTDKYSGRVFAIKKIDKYKIKQHNMLSQIWTEISIMYQINHRNIVRMFDHFESDSHLCLVMEYVEKGSLLQLLVRHKQLSEMRTKIIMKDIISAVEYLHKRTPPIIHRDIKPENILIDERDTAKLADFGWSNYSNYLRVTYCGTESYLAPEMILKAGHDEKLDYWCLGVLAY